MTASKYLPKCKLQTCRRYNFFLERLSYRLDPYYDGEDLLSAQWIVESNDQRC